MADYTTGGKGANLIFTAANAMSDTATLTLYGNTGSLVTLNANDTIGGLKLNGVKQLPGTYNSGNSSWITGTGTLTVNGATMAYWNPSGGPSGTWDDSNIWNNQANLAGTDNAWSSGTNRRVQCRRHLRRHARRHEGNRRPGGVQWNRHAHGWRIEPQLGCSGQCRIRRVAHHQHGH